MEGGSLTNILRFVNGFLFQACHKLLLNLTEEAAVEEHEDGRKMSDFL